ncbi:DNA repair protein RAD51 homolog 3 isoform 1-T1 [Menidia menidia]
MLRPLSSLSLSPGVRLKLLRAGFQFTAELQSFSPEEIAEEAGVSQQEAQEVLEALSSSGGAAPPLTALELLQKEEQSRSIVTFCSQLDERLKGGIPVGKLTEVCGAPGTGKTQLCLQAAVDVQVPQCFGGLGGQAVVMDTEGGVLLQRLDDMATAAVRHCSLLASDEEQRVAMATFTVRSVLENVFLVRCHDYTELLAEVRLLPGFLRERPGVRLVVVDSVAFPFRLHLDDLPHRTRLLQGLAQQLVAVATGHDVAVVVTNHMTTRLGPGGSRLVPALGDSWGHAPNIRLLLKWAGPRRAAAIFKSPAHLSASVHFQITSDGFRDAEEEPDDQPQSKRPRGHAHQSASGAP